MASDLDQFAEGVKFAREMVHKAARFEIELSLRASSEGKRGQARYASEKLLDVERTLDVLLEHAAAATADEAAS